ncbi:MAG: ribonuclease HI family protein, partial [Candidatus Omnitrophica bacterium]|nr:ribonuclease HI family protein [Candidatus Omnitrophota bacterium]
MNKVREFLINVDGACSGNPGDAAVGIVIRDKESCFEENISRYIGVGTNNIAEYTALLIGLERVLALGAQRVVIKSDSELLVKQLRGDYKVKN